MMMTGRARHAWAKSKHYCYIKLKDENHEAEVGQPTEESAADNELNASRRLPNNKDELV